MARALNGRSMGGCCPSCPTEHPTAAAGMQAVRHNRYVILPKDFEAGWKDHVTWPQKGCTRRKEKDDLYVEYVGVGIIV